jgi:hypothetical protein
MQFIEYGPDVNYNVSRHFLTMFCSYVVLYEITLFAARCQNFVVRVGVNILILNQKWKDTFVVLASLTPSSLSPSAAGAST